MGKLKVGKNDRPTHNKYKTWSDEEGNRVKRIAKGLVLEQAQALKAHKVDDKVIKDFQDLLYSACYKG